jgi:hypothetical protein
MVMHKIDVDKIFADSSSILITGDFNCKSPLWESRRANANGKRSAEIANPTHHPV